MNVADLIPAGRRPKGEGELQAPEAVEPAPGAAKRTRPEEVFADIMSGDAPVAHKPGRGLPARDATAPDALAPGTEVVPDSVAISVPVPAGTAPGASRTDPADAQAGVLVLDATVPEPAGLPDHSAVSLPVAATARPDAARPATSEEVASAAVPLAPQPMEAAGVESQPADDSAVAASPPDAPTPASVAATPSAASAFDVNPPKAAAGIDTAAAGDELRAESLPAEAGERQPSAPALPAGPSSTPFETRPPSPVPASVVQIDAAGIAPAWRLEAEAPGTPVARAELAQPGQSPQPVAQQIVAAVARAPDGQVEIRLDPPELGRVQITIETTDAGVRAVVLADRPETQDLLRRNADNLARDLGAAGFDRVSLDFSAGGQAAARHDRAAIQFAAAGQGASAGPPPPDVARPRPSATGGLDIRL